MTRPEREARPVVSGTGSDRAGDKIEASLADLDAQAEHLRGRFVVQVEVDDDKYRTQIYRSTAAAERAVHRANAAGKRAHTTLVQLLPVGVVVGLGGGRR
ncbi:MAG: hypothetical protein ACR2K2_09965 [Mycobacteriales bacterium]